MSDSKLEATLLGSADSRIESASVVVGASSAAADWAMMAVKLVPDAGELPARGMASPRAASKSPRTPLLLVEVDVAFDV